MARLLGDLVRNEDALLLPARPAHREPAVAARDPARARPHVVTAPAAPRHRRADRRGQDRRRGAARRALPIEAVNADSRQVYRGMDIGTGKPTAEEQAAAAAPRWSTSSIRTSAITPRGSAPTRSRAIAEIRARGRLPVVVGGTGLYVRALLKGLHPGAARRSRAAPAS